MTLMRIGAPGTETPAALTEDGKHLDPLRIDGLGTQSRKGVNA